MDDVQQPLVPTTHFGFREVAIEQKQQLVGGVFTSVAESYDIMNDMMSMGIHRLWKRDFVASLRLRPGQRVLDLAGGTGDISLLMAPKLRPGGEVVLSDINNAMLSIGRDRMIDDGHLDNCTAVQANAEALPFPDRSFDVVTIAFGLRNVTDKQAALNDMARVCKPGGKVAVLEFSQIAKPLRGAYDWYSFNILPKLGEWIASDGESYQYLAESIRQHPPQEELREMMNIAGLGHTDYRNLSAGMVAVHTGYAL